MEDENAEQAEGSLFITFVHPCTPSVFAPANDIAQFPSLLKDAAPSHPRKLVPDVLYLLRPCSRAIATLPTWTMCHSKDI